MREIDMIHAASGALRGLASAVKTMTAQTYPHTPLPNARVFEFRPNEVYWPWVNSNGTAHFEFVNVTYKGVYDLFFHDLDYLSVAMLWHDDILCDLHGLLLNIWEATAWCKARTVGRQRHAQNILRQQERYVKHLRDQEASMVSNGSGTDMDDKDRDLITIALSRLSHYAELLAWTDFVMPKGKKFELCPGVSWPETNPDGGDSRGVNFKFIDVKDDIAGDGAGNDLHPYALSSMVIARSGSPRGILAALKNINKAADWCAARVSEQQKGK